ncbi:uncharacterized protein BDZ83DRAFT_294625 [Colletotrichum acutatum]|uniref:Uncharacterized protein n=1 Tax=Glomerella acutata TaxID=27357 RepID=A0AAD8XPG3_GLOAC|nr:uncharacterized protein BDZ83DRAFT_294625 [Colletotrichum acutatum]KAK1731028.1 hypothetical protein BDZ83DRAFT_294625 [Colletotrichum acutatum]
MFPQSVALSSASRWSEREEASGRSGDVDSYGAPCVHKCLTTPLSSSFSSNKPYGVRIQRAVPVRLLRLALSCVPLYPCGNANLNSTSITSPHIAFPYLALAGSGPFYSASASAPRNLLLPPSTSPKLQAPSLTLTLPVSLIRGCVGKRLDRRHSPLFFVSSSALTIGSGWGAESRYSQPATRALEGWYGQAKLTVAVRWV